MRMTSAPPATPAYRGIQPTLWPMISITKTRPWLEAVVWMSSMQRVATSMALVKPKVMSVPQVSLSMVLGSAMTLSPSSRKRLAVLVEPLPPNTNRQSSL